MAAAKKSKAAALFGQVLAGAVDVEDEHRRGVLQRAKDELRQAFGRG